MLYLYDRVLFSPHGTALNNVHLQPLPTPYSPESFPDELADQKNLRSWQSLFKARREWANGLLSKCQSLRNKAEGFISQRAVLEQGVRVATTSVEAPIKAIEKRLVEITDGVKETSEDAQVKIKALDGDLARLADIPAIGSFSKFFVGHGATGRKRITEGPTTLSAFVDRNSAKAAAAESKSMFTDFSRQIKDFGASLSNLTAQIEELKRGLDVAQSRSLTDDGQEPTKLVSEIEAVASKISSDCDTILALNNDTKSVAQASRVALYHTKDLLPGLMDYAKEMSELLLHTVESRNAAVVRTADLLQMVASIESQQTALKESVNALKMTEEDWAVIDKISLPSEIPSIYGSLLSEAVRRIEWVNKMRRDSSSLQEEIAGYQEEEQRRRKKWVKGMKDLVPDNLDGTTLGMEINLQGGGEELWPEASRKDLDEYIKALQDAQGNSNTVAFLLELVKDMEKPTRQQVKRAKAFKNGSVHEAGFGKGSMLLRGEDEVRVFKEVITKLEEELKGHKSRIRKLEDLLHRQSQFSKISVTTHNGTMQDTGTPIDPPERALSVASPRRPSSSSRRFSANLSNDDKATARRILQLEAELAEEKRLRLGLEKELGDANFTKQDIMENMEARQIEFAEERKSLEDDNSRFKQRIEELEDELDRILGSRDAEKAGVDQRVQEIVISLDKARQEHANEVQVLQEKLQAQIHAQNKEIGIREQLEVDHKGYLASLLTSLSPQSAAPEDPAVLMTKLEEVAQRAADAASTIERELALARSDKASLQSTVASQRAEISAIALKYDSREADIAKTKEEVDSEKAKASSLATQLDDERAHLKELREKFADGETGSEALRRRLVEEESKVISLSSRLAEAKSHNNSLDVELISFQSKFRVALNEVEGLRSRLDERAQRAKEITHRLYSQNDRLFRLLEALGFVVSFEDGMVIQRASKIGTSSVLPDQSISVPSSSLVRSKKLFEDLSDLSCLLWMDKESPEAEASNFAEFMGKTDRLNLEALCEAISKRMRDIEHTARKYQREARAYRDKARRFQTDAHDKIAFRGFKDGDLALFLPTRNQSVRSWAAFNVGAPHYFLREQDSHRLANKEWLVARISKVQERIVDLSKHMSSSTRALDGETASEGGVSLEDDNPFDLSDGLRWYYLDATEEKPGAPSTPGLGKSTVAAANIVTMGSIRMTKAKGRDNDDVSKQLSKSLDSRRSSNASKKSTQIASALGITKPSSNEELRDDGGSLLHPQSPIKAGAHLRTPSQTSSLRNAFSANNNAIEHGSDDGNKADDEVRIDQLLGP